MVAQLPNELLQLIIHDATPESLRSFRLVNRQWSNASAPYLFERIHASLFKKPLANLTALSLSPLAKHVKAIDYHSDQLPYYARTEWESQLDLRQSYIEWRRTFGEDADLSKISRAYDKLPRHDFTPAQLEAGWLVYLSHYQDQYSWIDGKSGLVLRDCLPRFLNLREVVIDQAKPFQRRDHDKSYWNHFLKDALIRRNAWMFRKDNDEELAALSSLLMVIALGHRARNPGMKPVEELLLDLPSRFSFRDMVHLPLHYPLKTLSAQLPGSTNRSQLYESIVEVFRPLKDLTIQCPSVEDVEKPESKSQMQEINDFLASCVNLKSLSLDLGEPDRDYEGAGREDHHLDHGIVPILSHEIKSFPNLWELRISGSFPSAPFVQFLTLHADTLKRVEIYDSFSDDWYKVLETLGKTLKLEHVYVESLWYPGPEHDFGGEDPGLLLADGLDEDNDFAQDMKDFLYTGEGSLPHMDDYEMPEEYNEYDMAYPDEWDEEVDYSGFASDEDDAMDHYSGVLGDEDATMEEVIAAKEVGRAERWARWRAADEARLAGRADHSTH